MGKVYPGQSIVIFGAGKIGRSFIGQLFGCSGYLVTFIDIDQSLVDGLNAMGSYRIVIKGEYDTEILVPHVKAISATDREKTTDAVRNADILAVSVGKNAVEKVIPMIAEGLKQRFDIYPDFPLDIIIAENMRDATGIFRDKLKENLPGDYPLDKMVGLVETSIGKMVPIMSSSDLEKDPLMVFAEPYNTLIVDGKGFKSPVPGVKGLSPKDNIKAWVDRKAFIHNLGHATAAYFGSYKYPGAVYMAEILEDEDVFSFTRETMQQSATILHAAYPEDFTPAELEAHINDLLLRFLNKALKDTIFRVGHDIARKLGKDDRFMGAIQLARKFQMPYNKILEASCYGLKFRAADEDGKYFLPDMQFAESLVDGFESAMVNILGLDLIHDRYTISELKRFYDSAKSSI